MPVIGIDYSISGPAIAVLGHDFNSSIFYFATTKKKSAAGKFASPAIYPYLIDKDYLHNIHRYDRLSDWAIECIRPHIVAGQTTLVMEGYAFGSSAGLVCNIAENGGMLKYKLFKEFGLHPEIVAPTSLKKAYTGNGRAKKPDMIQALLDQEGVDILKLMCMSKPESPAADIVDAYALAKTWVDGNPF